MADPHLAAMELTLLPLNWSGRVDVRSTLDARVSNRGVLPVAPSFDTVGPIARTAEDCALLLVAVAGHDPGDPTTVDAGVTIAGSSDAPIEPTDVLAAMADKPSTGMATSAPGSDRPSASVVTFPVTRVSCCPSAGGGFVSRSGGSQPAWRTSPSWTR